MKPCCIFSYSTVDEALDGSPFAVVEDFGGAGEGYSWMNGSRKLCMCENCGALFLCYKIKFLSMGYDSDEKSYTYYLPVNNRAEALAYCEKYIGSTGLSDSYNGKKIWFNGTKWCWQK